MPQALTHLRTFLALLWPRRPLASLAAIALATLLSLTEGIGLAMAFPLIALLNQPSSPHAETPRTAILFHLLTAAHIPRPTGSPPSSSSSSRPQLSVAQLNAALSTLTFSIVLPLRQRLAPTSTAPSSTQTALWLTRRRASTLTHYLTAELNRTGILAGNLIAILSNAMVASSCSPSPPGWPPF